VPVMNRNSFPRRKTARNVHNEESLMTALDQAFIKAFAQQGPSTAAIPSLPSKSAPAAPPLGSNRVGNVLATLERTPTRQKAEGGRRKAEKVQESERETGIGACVWEQAECGRGIGNGPSIPLSCESWTVDRGPWTACSEPLAVSGWPSIESWEYD